MINIIAGLLIVHYLIYLILQPKGKTLGCGLFAWAGDDPAKFNKDKFDKLGIFNETRGEHSCGVSTDGDIYIGVNGYKVYRDFIAEQDYPLPQKVPSVIGHTRHATFGVHNLENSHPFGFGSKDGDFEFIGVHNGSLINHEELGKKYGVDLKHVNSKNVSRDKIDSEVILEIIYNSKNYKVLNDYNGAAALIFTDLNKPDTIYCYHGESKKFYYDKTVAEERPLFYYKEKEGSLYISSLEKSLKAINPDNTKTIGSFDYNCVYEIKNGDIDNAKKTKLKRTDNFQKGSKPVNSTSKTYTAKNNNSNSYRQALKLPEHKSKGNNTIKEAVNIHTEKTLKNVNDYNGAVYYQGLRFKRNGHNITGCFTWIPDYGYYFLGRNRKDAEETFWNLTNKWFFENDFVYKEEDVDKDNSYIPFPHNKEKEITKPVMFYFFEGIMMLQYLDYSESLKRQNSPIAFNWMDLSVCSKYPVINDEVISSSSKQNIILNRDQYNGIIAPLGSDKIYYIKNGNLIGTEPIVEEKLTKIEMKELLKELGDEDTQEIDYEDVSDIEDESNDLLEEIIHQAVLTPFRDFPRYINQLKKYNNYERSVKVQKILQTFIDDTKKLVALEPKNS